MTDAQKSRCLLYAHIHEACLLTAGATSNYWTELDALRDKLSEGLSRDERERATHLFSKEKWWLDEWWDGR